MQGLPVSKIPIPSWSENYVRMEKLSHLGTHHLPPGINKKQKESSTLSFLQTFIMSEDTCIGLYA